MFQVTDLQPGKKDPKRINVYLNGKFAFAVSLEIKILQKLKVGEQIPQEKIDQLIFQDQTNRLYEKAIKLLSYRPRSRKEIQAHLLQKLKLTDKAEAEKKNFEKSVEEVLSRLEKIGQVNDSEFAKWWVEQRTKFKKTSPRIVKSELLSKGIDREIVAKVLAAVEIDPIQLATDAVRKKLPRYKNLDPKEFRLKTSRFLASKGFDWEVVKKVVDSLRQDRVK
jgi:regulatory protein